MIRYPNGNVVKTSQKTVNAKPSDNSSNRGMSLENDINQSIAHFSEENMALITKRPTPININKVDYSHGARITDAYFEKQSTTDYNGVYKGKYIDFEAKSTHNTTSFPLTNITAHQITHLRKVIAHEGIAFFVISFTELGKVYLLDAAFVIDFFDLATRKSIPLSTIETKGVEIKQGFIPRLELLQAIDEVYFHEKIS